jgi:hypothetical protein
MSAFTPQAEFATMTWNIDYVPKAIICISSYLSTDQDGLAGFNRPVIYSSIAVAQRGHRGFMSTGLNRLAALSLIMPTYP